jgi:hypothetical protein
LDGIKKLYPDRFDAKGVELQSCVAATGKRVYGDANCKTIVDPWVKAEDAKNATKLCLNIPVKDLTAAQKGKSCQDAANQFCFENDVSTGGKFEKATFATGCDLVEDDEPDFGYARYIAKKSITCKNSAFKALEGIKNCVKIYKTTNATKKTWEARSDFINVDQARFRTFGEKIAKDAKTKGAVKEADIKCLGADFYTVKTGSANCWPFWVEGGSKSIGKTSTQAPIKQDVFIWMT